jgi:hypothetical protein
VVWTSTPRTTPSSSIQMSSAVGVPDADAVASLNEQRLVLDSVPPLDDNVRTALDYLRG